MIDALLARGATRVNIGQDEPKASWTVLAGTKATNLRAVSTGQLMGADPGSPTQVGAVLPPRDVSIRLVQDRRIEDLIDTWCGRVRYPKPPTTSQAVAARVA